jgi:hypothetical protein
MTSLLAADDLRLNRGQSLDSAFIVAELLGSRR